MVICIDFRPLALRPRLLPGLPLSDVVVFSTDRFGFFSLYLIGDGWFLYPFCLTGFTGRAFVKPNLSVDRPYDKKNLASDKQSQIITKSICDLRRPGNHGHWFDFRPLALRPRFSPGLPLSDFYCFQVLDVQVFLFSFQGVSGSHQTACFLVNVNITLNSHFALNHFVRWADCLRPLLWPGQSPSCLNLDLVR